MFPSSDEERGVRLADGVVRQHALASIQPPSSVQGRTAPSAKADFQPYPRGAALAFSFPNLTIEVEYYHPLVVPAALAWATPLKFG